MTLYTIRHHYISKKQIAFAVVYVVALNLHTQKDNIDSTSYENSKLFVI